MGATYKLKRKLADGTLEDVILQGVGGGSCVITDLGQLDGHQPAEDTILELLKPTSVPQGKYLYTYWTSCSSDATLVICYKDEYSIIATQYTSRGQFRKFYYDFNEDSVIEHHCLREMGVELTEELGNRGDVAMSQSGVTQALAQVGGIPFIPSDAFTVDNGTGVIAQKWAVADVGGITTATDGMTVAVRMPTGGGSYGVNLSIDGGNTYYPIVQNVNTLIRMTYSQGSTLILTFNANQTVRAYMTENGMTTVTGCWQTTDIDTNNQVSQYHTTTDDKFPLIFKYSSGVTSTSTQQAMARYANNMYVNPSTGTIYANDFVVDGKSIVGTSIPKKISSTTTSININSSTVGAYFNLFGTVDGADELTIGSETIALDSNLVYFVSVEGMLYGIVSGSYFWRVTVRVSDDSGATSYYNYQITSTSGLNIADTGQPSGAYCRYTGILCG